MSTLNEIARNWWFWVGQMYWQVSLLVLLISGLDILLKRWAWPQVRYALWLLVLIKLVVPPTWSMPSSIVSRTGPVLQKTVMQTIEQSKSRRDRDIFMPQIPGQSYSALDSPGRSAVSEEGSAVHFRQLSVKPTWQTYAMGMWLAGIAVFVLLLVGKMIRLRRWHQQQKERTIPAWFHELLVSTAQRLRLSRLPAIVFTAQAKTPAVYGMFRPVLLLPVDYFERLSGEEAQHVLLHELAHLKRGDLWLHGICLILQVLYWYNPMIMWVRRQMKHVREICCDLTVANILREQTGAYRQTLLNTARELLTETVEPGLGLLGVFEEPFRLVTRLKWLEKKTWENRRLMSVTACCTSLIVVACFLPMAGLKQNSPYSSTDPGKKESDLVLAESFRAKGRTDSIQVESRSPKQEYSIDSLELTVEIKKTDMLYAVVLPMVGPPDRCEDAMHRLKNLCKERGLRTIGDPFGRFFSDPEEVPKEKFSWEVGYRVEQGTEVDLPLEIIQVEPMQVASAQITGIRDTDLVWSRFIEVLADRGYVPAFPPALEIYRGESVAQEFWWITEMQIQVFRPEEGYPGLSITAKRCDPVTAIVLPMQGSYAQHSRAWEKLQGYIEKKNIRVTGEAFGRYFSDASEVAPVEYFWQVGYPVQEGTKVDPPFEIETIDSCTVASTVLIGSPVSEYPWSPFIMQMILMGMVPVGPAMEIYSEFPDDRLASEAKVEMRIPIMQMGPLSQGPETGGESFAERMKSWAENFAGIMAERAGSVSGRNQGGIGMKYDLVPKTIDAFDAVVLPFKGSGLEIGEKVKELQHFLQKRNIKPSGPSFIHQLCNPEITPIPEQKWEVGYPVDHAFEVSDPFEIRRFESQQMITSRIVQPLMEDDFNQQLASWFYQNNAELDGSPMIYCPDRLYKRKGEGDIRVWDIHIPIEFRRDKFPPVDVYTMFAERQIAVVLPMKGSWDQQQEAVDVLKAYLKEIGVKSDGIPFIRYFNNKTYNPEEELMWEVGVSVPKGTGVKAPFEIRIIDEGLSSYTEVECKEDEVETYWYSFAFLSQSEGYFMNGYPMKFIKSELDGKGTYEFRHPVREKREKSTSLPAFY